MAYDTKLYLRDSAVSNSLFAPLSTGTVLTSPNKILLPGVPLRGLELNVVAPAMVSTASLVVELWQAVTTGATFIRYRSFPAITAAGDYHFRFHLDPGYQAVAATFSLSGATGAGFGNVDVRIGMDQGAWGNPNPT